MVDGYARPHGDEDMLRESLADLAGRTGFPIVFGGFAEHGQVRLTQLLGNKGDSLRGLEVRIGSGLGGRTLLERRPRLTTDYGTSRAITHDYDHAVLAEGITTLMAIPVEVDDTVAAVIYGGVRTRSTIGGVSIGPSVDVAHDFGRRLVSRSSVAQAQERSSDKVASIPERRFPVPQLEEIRRLYADVRGLEAAVMDPVMHAQLADIAQRLVAIAAGEHASESHQHPQDRLTPREADVLSLVALGYGNATVGKTLGVAEATVKSYMNSVMRKLGTTNRFEAVATARRLMLLP